MVGLFIALFIGLVTLLYLLVVVKGHPATQARSEDIVRVRGVRLTSEKASAGVLISFMGAISLMSWAYFLYEGFGAFVARAAYLAPHVLMQLAVSLFFLVAGHAVLRGWRRHTMIFFLSVAAAMAVSLFSLAAHGHEAHLASMHVFSTLVQVVGSIFASAVYMAGLIFVEEQGSYPARPAA